MYSIILFLLFTNIHNIHMYVLDANQFTIEPCSTATRTSPRRKPWETGI